MREVLQLPGRVERLEGFEEPLQAAEPILPVFLFLLRQDRAAPEDQFGDARLRGDDLAEKLGGALLNFGHPVVPVRGIDDEPLRHVEQIAQILKRPERQIARAIDVLELGDLGDSDLRELVDAGRVDLLPGKAEDDVAAVDQGGQNHAQEFRFDPKLGPVVDAGLRGDQFGPIEHLALAFLAQSIEHVLAVARVARLERFAVQQLQRIQDRGALLALHATGNPPQRFLRGLIPVLPCDQNAEDRVLGALVGEVRRQQRRSRGVDVVLDRRVRRQLAANDLQQASLIAPDARPRRRSAHARATRPSAPEADRLPCPRRFSCCCPRRLRPVRARLHRGAARDRTCRRGLSA